jgi:type IV secretory pathway TraG/TraD family ATPase VirD4
MTFGGAIDFGALHREVTTIYLILPLKELTKQAKWLRLFVNVALAKLYESAPIGRAALPPVMLMLDEYRHDDGARVADSVVDVPAIPLAT